MDQTTHKAFLCSLQDGSFPAIVISQTHGKAKAAMTRSANDAGYNMAFPEFRVKRAPEYDDLALPLPCSRQFPRNRPVTVLDIRTIKLDACGCTKCQQSSSLLPNAEDNRR